MKSEIVIPARPISKPLQELIDEHNARVERIWLTTGSRCMPANAKRAAAQATTLSELLRPEAVMGQCLGLRSDGSSPTCLMKDYAECEHQ